MHSLCDSKWLLLCCNSWSVLVESVGTQYLIPQAQLPCKPTATVTAVALLLLLPSCACCCCRQGIPVLTALGEVLEQHLGYVRDVHYLRLDGAVTAEGRAKLIRQFNSDSSKARVSGQAV
jgi:hypothetical protein